MGHYGGGGSLGCGAGGMKNVETRHDADAGVVLFIMRGRVTLEDFLEAGDAHFGRHATPRAVWDLRRADLSGLEVEDLKRVAARSREAAVSRSDPRTALVVDSEADMLLARLFDALSETRESPVIYEVFFDLEPAWAWLGVDNPFPDRR